MPKLQPWRPVAYRSPDLVLHVTLALEWGFVLPVSQYADDLMQRMPRLVSIVPTLWSRQLADVVLGYERAGRITTAKAAQCFGGMYPFQVAIDPETSALAWTDILDLARTHSTSIDEAAYIELALRLNLPLATTDTTLTRIAVAAGVPIFTP